MQALDFTGKRVLVVGGSSGIGCGIAQAFRAQGAEVHVWGTRASADDYQGADGSDLTGLHYAQMDVTDFDRIESYQPPFASLDTLVLSQGIALYKRAEFKMDGFQRVVDTNLNSLMACALKFQPMLQQSKGTAIMVSSAAAFHAARGNPAYAASKSAAVALVRTLGQVWAGEGVRVNGIAPGFVATKMTTVTTENPDRLASTLARIPAGRLGTVQDMANAALFLASPMSGYMYGQTLIVDGGIVL